MDPQASCPNTPCGSVTSYRHITPRLPATLQGPYRNQSTHSSDRLLIQITQTKLKHYSILKSGRWLRVCAIQLQKGTESLSVHASEVCGAVWWHAAQARTCTLHAGSVIQTCRSPTSHSQFQVLRNQRGKAAVTNCSGFPRQTGFFPMPNTIQTQNILFHEKKKKRKKKTLPGIHY